MSSDLEEDILRALRRITRAIDLHSRQLASTYGLTGPQLVALRTVARRGPLKPSEIAHEISLSQATITGIVDRLAARQLVVRERSSKDRRHVTITITPAGHALVDVAPSPLQEEFARRLASLSEEEQTIIRVTLNKIVRMMGGEDLAAAPVLSTSLMDIPGSEISSGAGSADGPVSTDMDDPDVASQPGLASDPGLDSSPGQE